MKKEEFASTKDRIQSEYWIDKEGRIKKWEWSLREANNWTSLHSGIAERILKHIPEIANGRKCGCDTLHKLGWIAIGSACYGIRIDNKPTQGQINTLYSLGFNKITDMSGKTYKW